MHSLWFVSRSTSGKVQVENNVAVYDHHETVSVELLASSGSLSILNVPKRI